MLTLFSTLLNCGRHFLGQVEGRVVEDDQRPRQHQVHAAARRHLADDHAKGLLDLDQRLLRRLLDGAAALAEDALAVGDAVLQAALALAQLVGRQGGALVGSCCCCSRQLFCSRCRSSFSRWRRRSISSRTWLKAVETRWISGTSTMPMTAAGGCWPGGSGGGAWVAGRCGGRCCACAGWPRRALRRLAGRALLPLARHEPFRLLLGQGRRGAQQDGRGRAGQERGAKRAEAEEKRMDRGFP